MWSSKSYEHADSASAGAEARQHRALSDRGPGPADDHFTRRDGHAVARTVSSCGTNRPIELTEVNRTFVKQLNIPDCPVV